MDALSVNNLLSSNHLSDFLFLLYSLFLDLSILFRLESTHGLSFSFTLMVFFWEVQIYLFHYHFFKFFDFFIWIFYWVNFMPRLGLDPLSHLPYCWVWIWSEFDGFIFFNFSWIFIWELLPFYYKIPYYIWPL